MPPQSLTGCAPAAGALAVAAEATSIHADAAQLIMSLGQGSKYLGSGLLTWRVTSADGLLAARVGALQGKLGVVMTSEWRPFALP